MMSRKHSPFAALTSREQQERWLEFQNTKLPYVTGDVDTSLSEKDSDWLGRYVERAIDPPAPRNASTQNGRYSTEQEGRTGAQAFQKTSHRQYDAIVRRMMEAEKQAVQYQSSFPAAHL